MYLLVAALVGVVAAVIGMVVVVVTRAGKSPWLDAIKSFKPMWFYFAMAVMFLVMMLMFVALIKPYVTARMQNLVWAHTRSDDVRILSTLKARSMLWLSIKNWFLVVCTLGLYWPFAAIARARMQLEAMGIASQVSLDSLVQQGRATEGEAAGDAAGDLFGLDIGF